MRIIVDAYGGDNAPEAVLRGCRMAADQWKCEIILTGDGEKLRARAAELGVSLEGMTIAEAPDVFPMEAEPTAIMKQYKDSSMARGLQMLAEGGGEALVSAGSTGALVVGGTLIVKRIKGVKRPAIGTVVPCKDGCFMMLDSGANHDCRPEMLRQFGLMGSVSRCGPTSAVRRRGIGSTAFSISRCCTGGSCSGAARRTASAAICTGASISSLREWTRSRAQAAPTTRASGRISPAETALSSIRARTGRCSACASKRPGAVQRMRRCWPCSVNRTRMRMMR